MSYEEQRLARVRRNAEMLKSLGLDTALNDVSADEAASEPSRKRRRRERDDDEPAERRWSSRLLERQFGGDDPVLSYADEPEREKSRDSKDSKRTTVRVRPAPRPPLEAAPDKLSSKNLNADVDSLVLSLLGKRLPRLGAWKESCFRALCPGKEPKFNKYAGIAEFRNAIVLFLNMQTDGTGGGSYDNKIFRDKSGRYLLDYYASEKQNTETPVIKRLRTKSDQVVLFARPVANGSPAEAYYFAGRMELDEEDTSRVPLLFRFEMLDAEGILKDGDEVLRDILFGEKDAEDE